MAKCVLEIEIECIKTLINFMLIGLSKACGLMIELV